MEAVDGAPSLLLSVVVPRGTAERLWGAPGQDAQATMRVVTGAGAAQQVAGEVAPALRPDTPGDLGVVPPPDPRTLREGVSSHIARQILTGSGALGAIGGTVGASLGLVVVVAVCIPRAWSPVVEPALVLCAPLVGLGVGLLAGGYPAVRAGRIEPVDALRR
ncbi:hypothetical protein [Cellulomonas hominis]